MRANSRSSIRWRVATAVVALTLCVLPKAALADGGGNGRLVAVRLAEPAGDSAMTEQEKKQPTADVNAAAGVDPKIRIDQQLGRTHDGIGDDSDVASVEGSANDDDTVDAGDESSGGSF
jgi:hypothetical protein